MNRLLMRMAALLLALCLIGAASAETAPAEATPYELLASWLNGREITIGVQLEEKQLTGDIDIPLDSLTCTVRAGEGRRLEASVSLDGEAESLLLTLTPEGATLAGSRVGEAIACTWAELNPQLTLTEGEQGTKTLRSTDACTLTSQDEEVGSMTMRVEVTVR